MRSLSTSAVTLKWVKVFLLEAGNVEDPRTGLLKEAVFPAAQKEGRYTTGRPGLRDLQVI